VRGRNIVRSATLAAFALIATSAVAADLDDIKARGYLNAATSGNLPPVAYVNEKNELVGYDIEVAHAVEKRLGFEIRINKLDWKGILPGLQTGRFDAVFSNVNATDERKTIFDFSIPYSRSAVVVVRRAGLKDINSYKDLKGRKVGAIAGGNDGEKPARAMEAEIGGFADFKGYAGYAEMFADLAIGRIDALVAPDTAAANFIRERPGIGEIAGAPYSVSFVSVPMQKGSPKLKAEIDAVILDLKSSGKLDEWGKTYFGIDKFSAQLPN
jgi:ABC-type amino acid transport substrate-binding protein